MDWEKGGQASFTNSSAGLLGCEYKEIDRRLSSCPPIVQLLSSSTRSRHFHQPVSTICRPDLKLMTTAAATCSSRQQSAVNHQKVPQLLRLLVSSPARKFWYVHFIISKSTCNLIIIGFLIHAESRYTRFVIEKRTGNELLGRWPWPLSGQQWRWRRWWQWRWWPHRSPSLWSRTTQSF